MADQTITSVQAPWATQIPYLQQAFQGAQSLYGQGGPEWYNGSTVAPMNQQSINVLGNAINTGLGQQNAQYLGAADQQLNDTLAGNYLNANPYLDATFNKAADAVTRQFSQATLPGMNAAFTMAGRSGSGAQQNALDWQSQAMGRNLNELATDIYGGNYQAERARQMQGLGMVPSLFQNRLTGIESARKATDVLQGQSQAELTDQVNRFNFNQMRPYENLKTYLGNVGGAFGGQASQTRPLYENSTAQNLGLATTGIGLLGSLLGFL